MAVVGAGALKRLARVQAALCAPPGQRRRVMVVPPILPLDQWEAIAVPQQRKLLEDAASDIADPLERMRSTLPDPDVRLTR